MGVRIKIKKIKKEKKYSPLQNQKTLRSAPPRQENESCCFTSRVKGNLVSMPSCQMHNLKRGCGVFLVNPVQSAQNRRFS